MVPWKAARRDLDVAIALEQLDPDTASRAVNRVIAELSSHEECRLLRLEAELLAERLGLGTAHGQEVSRLREELFEELGRPDNFIKQWS